ncbi:unnamed protein product [Closterium sp. Naga37s-1]|nr:unnamed protein product [Closterium sp. Naga37s-1]
MAASVYLCRICLPLLLLLAGSLDTPWASIRTVALVVSSIFRLDFSNCRTSLHPILAVLFRPDASSLLCAARALRLKPCFLISQTQSHELP